METLQFELASVKEIVGKPANDPIGEKKVAPKRKKSFIDAIQQMDHDEAHAKYAQYYALYVTNGVKAADKGDRLLNICRMLSNQMFSLTGNDKANQERTEALNKAANFIKYGRPGTKKAATRQSKSTPENGSSQVQSRAVADGVPQAIIDFEDNEKNRKILDELFELLLEDPCINGAGAQEERIKGLEVVRTEENAELTENIIAPPEVFDADWDAQEFDFSIFN